MGGAAACLGASDGVILAFSVRSAELLAALGQVLI